MSLSVNFAYHLTKQRSKEQAKDRRLFKKVAIVGVVALVITGISLAFRIGFDLAYKAADKNEKQTLAQLETLKSEELTYVGYVTKVNVLSELFKNRQAKQQALKRFRSLFGPGVSITGLQYSKEENDLGFRLKTSTVFLLEQVINQLDEPSLRTEYKEIEKTSVSRSEDGTYSMQVSVGLNIVSPTPTPTPKTKESK